MDMLGTERWRFQERGHGLLMFEEFVKSLLFHHMYREEGEEMVRRHHLQILCHGAIVHYSKGSHVSLFGYNRSLQS